MNMTSTTPASPKSPGWIAAVRQTADRNGIELSPIVPLSVLVVVVLIVGIIEPAFLTATSMQSTLTTAAPILMLAIGSALVKRVATPATVTASPAW